MKGRILRILRAENKVVSGEMLSDRLGVSRVSIWKHVCKLKELGYLLDSTPKGYRLIDDCDALYPWEFPTRESNIHYFDQAGSTMEIAGDLARKGCPEFTIVIAGQQTSGRGRLKRTWLSSAGGLYFTMVLRPQIPPVISTRINLAASVILVRTLRRLFAVEAMVKWPNDIMVADKKLAGLLSEMAAEADAVAYINIGMGINVNNDPTPDVPVATSLKEVLGREVSRRELLTEFLDEFENYIGSTTLDDVVLQWKQYTVTLNRYVKIVTTQKQFEGFAVDVDQDGALLLELADGSMQKVIYGDCFHQ